MKLTRLWCASLATLLAACLTHAADPKPVARVISILEVETENPAAYAARLGEYNRIAKTKVGADNYLRVFESIFDGEKTGRLRVSVAAKSVAELTKHAAALEPDLAALQKELRGSRQLGGRTLYQAARFDGSDKGGSLLSTLAVVNDEPGYLKALDELRALLDASGFKDAKINVYRVLAGRTDHTHRINVGSPNAERFAELLDFLGTNERMRAWLNNSAKFRTVVSNSSAREITP